MNRKRILVINPNSNERVTQGLRESLLMFADAAEIECRTLEDGPFGIESDDDIAAVVPLILASIEAAPEFDAYVIGCYSDPGLARCRQRFGKPVYGIQQSAIEQAAACGGRFGVLALSDASIARHMGYIERLGFTDLLAGELPLDVSVDAAASDPATLDRLLVVGRRLIDDFGATVLILGCAGMAALRARAEQALGVPVIEPVQAAVSLAIDA
jgi:Asp/Glu/hydantoin racemase